VCEDCGMCQTHGNVMEIRKGEKDSNGYTRCWPGKHAEGTKQGKNGPVRNCVPNESVEEDLSRRGFLKGMGAAAVAGAAGDAKADRNWTKDELTGSAKATMTSENFKGAFLHYNEESKSLFVNLVEPTNFTPANTERGNLYYPKITSPVYQLRFGQLPIMKGQGKVFSFPIRQLGDYNGSGIMLITTPKAFDSITEPFFYANKVILRLEIDGQPTNIVFNESPSVIELRKRLDASGAKQGIPSPYHNESVQQGVAEELNEEFDLIESIIEGIAAHNGVDAEAVWEDLESLTEDELYAFAVTSQLNEDWQKANKQDRTAGMSQKAVNAYRREHPGSKLKTAVTTKPSKLKRGSKASKRRKSYCSRSKGQMNMHNISCAKTPDKAICKARRRWNC